MNVFCKGCVSNKDRPDSKQLGATAAALYEKGKEFNHAEQTWGETVTGADTMLRALHSGLDTLTDFLAMQDPQRHTNAVILIPSSFAISKALDASPHEEQQVSIGYLERLSELLLIYPNMNVKLLWAPRKIPFVGFKRAK